MVFVLSKNNKIDSKRARNHLCAKDEKQLS